MSRASYLMIFFVSLSIVACASNQKKAPEIKEEFVTKIEQNGLKLFSYTVTMAMPEGRSGGKRSGGGGMRGIGMGGGGMGGGGMRGGGMGGGGMRGGGMKGGGMGRGGVENGDKPDREAMMNRFKKVVYDKLDTKLSETGYCRESYMELDNYFVRGRSQIRGECKDSATAEDRMTFINDENT